MKIRIFLIFITGILLLGCSDPKIDISSEAAMKASLNKIRESLPDAKRQEFDEAMQILVFSKTDIKGLFVPDFLDVGDFKSEMRKELDGKSCAQIITKANQVKNERKRIERQQVQQEIDKLEEKRKASIYAQEQLKKLKILTSGFYTQKQGLYKERPVIELKIENETPFAISKAYFEFTLFSPGNSIPWHQSAFQHDIFGGLEPGKIAHWHLALDTFSDWEKIKIPKDTILNINVVRIDGPDGEALYSAAEFNEQENRRLTELKEKYSKI